MGTGHVEVLDKKRQLVQAKKGREVKTFGARSLATLIRTEINTSTGLRDYAADLEEASKETK